MPDKERMRLGAIILAGGRSARMGRPKEALPFDGAPLLTRIAQALAPGCDPVVVVARDAAQELPPLPVNALRAHDEVAGRGPLAGLAAGLRRLLAVPGFGPDDAAFVVACDHPFVDAGFARFLADRIGAADAALPEVGGRPNRCAPSTGCAACRASMPCSRPATPARARWPTGVRRTWARRRLRDFDPALRALRDVDTAADFDAARREDER